MPADWGAIPLVFAQAEQGPSLLGMLLPFVVIAVLFYFMLIRPQQREQARTRQMQDNLKKNDRVITSGGILGTVVNAPKDSPFITIRVDESSNTRLRVTRRSILQVLTDEELSKLGEES